jgi:acyl carrier protein
VQQAAVLAREAGAGLEDKRLTAYLIPAKLQPALDAAELRRFLLAKLPHYMIPSHFVWLDRFPLTPNGKLDHTALPLPDPIRPDISTAYVPPRTSTEKILVNLWAETLGLERVGVDDNFIELGGHSLLATRLVSRLRDVFQLELPLSFLFEAGTVATLAQYVDTLTWAGQAPPLMAVSQETEEEGGGYRDEGEL